MSKLIPIALTALISGCATVGNYQTTIAVQSAEAIDRVTEANMWYFCKGMSIGSWRRQIGNSGQRAMAWAILCTQQDTVPFVPGDNEEKKSASRTL